MCGIWAAVSAKGTNLASNELAFLNNAMIAGTLRGAHGTGYVWQQGKAEKGKIWYHKDALTGSEMPKITTRKGGGGIPWVFGHNRYATVGGVDASTAHPFDAPHIIGIHNGTLSYDWQKRLNANKKVTVDSEAMMRAISHRGPHHALSNAHGAIATIFCDKKTNRVLLFRNSERPVSYAMTTVGTLILASEAGMLEWLAERNSMTLTTDGIQSVPVDTLFDITDAKLAKVMDIKGSGTPAVRNYTAYTTGRGNKYNMTRSSGQRNLLSQSVFMPTSTKCECTVCGADLAKADTFYEMGYTPHSKYHLCDDAFCVAYLADELAPTGDKIFVPTVLKVRDPKAEFKSPSSGAGVFHTIEFGRVK